MSETIPSPEQPKSSRCKYCHEEITWKRDANGFPFPERDGIDHRMNCSYMEKIRMAIGAAPPETPKPEPVQDILTQFRRIDTDLSSVRKIIDPILSGECEDAIIITVKADGSFRNAFIGDPRRAICYLEHTKAQILNLCYGPPATEYDDFDEEDGEEDY